MSISFTAYIIATSRSEAGQIEMRPKERLLAGRRWAA
jgi:hypothetical protein